MRFLHVSLLVLLSCGGASATAVPAPGAAPAPPIARPASEPGGWSCIGDPPDVAAGWKLEMAAVPLRPGSLEEAMRAAQDKLRTKLCVNAERDPVAADACLFLASKLEPWKTGRNERETCASAVIKRQYIDEWQALASDLVGFDAKLAASAKVLLQAVPSKTPRIALAAVYDDGGSNPKKNQLPGGLRADWLASRFRAQFANGVVAVPKGWADGQPAPADVDLVVVGRMFKPSTVTIPTIDVSWTAYLRDGRVIETSSGSFPESAAPLAPAATPPAIPTTAGLFVSMDSDHAGSICAGETTQIWVKSSEEAHVRVFDLYGKDGAMLVFPPSATRSDVIPAGRTQPIGDEGGFEVVPLPGYEDERYLVIASPTVAGLGRFAAAKSTCRVTDADAAALHRGDLPPGVKVAVTGYRVLTGKGCPKPPSPEHANLAKLAIARLPACAR